MDDLRAQPVESYGTILLTEEALTESTVSALVAMLDAQPTWSNLPVTLLNGRASKGPGLIRSSPAEMLGARQGVVVLDRPIRVATFVSILQSAVLARQRQYELRDQLVARAKAETHAQMLTAEMGHRIKNLLALIGAIASQTFRQGRPARDALDAFSARLKAMAGAQDILIQAAGDGASLHQLVSMALEPYQQRDAPDRIAISGPGAWIDGPRSASLTMAMHELATNAVKYGALSVDGGCVTVCWRIEDTSGVRCLHLEWRERGGPSVKPPKQRGFGSRLIERALAMELRGKAEIAFRPEGVVCEITAFLEAVAPE